MVGEVEKIPFQKLTSAEVADLLEEMKQLPPVVVASFAQGSPQRFQIFEIDRQKPAKAYLERGEGLQSGKEFLVNFGLKSGVYFLKSLGQKNDRGYFLDFSGDIYKIQRRENFRCPIPDGVSAIVKVYTASNSPPLSGEYQLRNISGQGVALNLPKEADSKIWQTSSEIFLDLNILNLSFTKMRALVRHVHPGVDHWAGLEFPELDFAKETELSSLSLQLQRILFQAHSEG